MCAVDMRIKIEKKWPDDWVISKKHYSFNFVSYCATTLKEFITSLRNRYVGTTYTLPNHRVHVSF